MREKANNLLTLHGNLVKLHQTLIRSVNTAFMKNMTGSFTTKIDQFAGRGV